MEVESLLLDNWCSLNSTQHRWSQMSMWLLLYFHSLLCDNTSANYATFDVFLLSSYDGLKNLLTFILGKIVVLVQSL